MFNKINDFVSGKSLLERGTIGLGMVSILGLFDYFTGPEISFSLFYAIPISFLAWYGSKWMGLSLSAMAAATWMLADHFSGHLYSYSGIPVWNAFVRMSFFVVITLLISKIKKMFELEESLADTDPLTGLANRRSFHEKAQFELERCKRYNRPFTVAYLDLDNFKYVNDQQGHEAGDELLITVAEEMKSRMRRTDISSRLGGDEFAVLLADTPKMESAVALRNLRKNLLQHMKQNNWPVTFSIGAITLAEPMKDVRDMMKLCDDLMYHVKRNGKNSIAHVTWPLPARLPRDLSTLKVAELGKAVLNGNL
ncbi:GGDEF domain-containing protein [Fibrobacterota bacterium]